jgi:hypothetical protein
MFHNRASRRGKASFSSFRNIHPQPPERAVNALRVGYSDDSGNPTVVQLSDS